MSMANLLVAVAALAVVWGIASGVLIFQALRRKGETTSFLWIRLFLPAYVHKYSVTTRAETGRTGPLFYHFVIAFNVALVAVILAVVVTQL